MIHKIRGTVKFNYITVFMLAVFILGFLTKTVYAATIVEGSYSIAVKGDGVSEDGMNNVLVYLKYTEEGEINATKVDFNLQLAGSTADLQKPENYVWEISFGDSKAQTMFKEWPVPEGGSYTRSYDILPNRDSDGNYIPSVKKATITVKYADGTVLASKTVFVITPISMSGFDTDVSSKYLVLKRTDDDLDTHRDLDVSKTLDISKADNVEWFYRPLSSNKSDDWKLIPQTAISGESDNNFINIRIDKASRKVTFSAKKSSGAIKLIGRIKENGYYSETVEFDILIAAYSPGGLNTEGRNLMTDATYGTKIYYNSVVRHVGDLNVSILYQNGVDEEQQEGVFKQDEVNRQFIANYYGNVTFQFCPVNKDMSDIYAKLYDTLKCTVESNVVFDVIKAVGSNGWTRVEPGSNEILSVGSTISVMTNVRGINNPLLSWAAMHPGESVGTALEGYDKGDIDTTPFNASTYSAGYRIYARSGTEIEIICSERNISEERAFKLIVTDGLEIEPSSASLSVGDSINIAVSATDASNPIYWDIVDALGNPVSGCIDFASDPSGKTVARITALKPGVAYVTASQSTGAGYRIYARSGTEIEIICSERNISEERAFKLIVTDGLEIEPSSASLSVGDSINIAVSATDASNPIYWDIVDALGNPVSGCIDFASDPSGKTVARITALKPGVAYVTASQSTGNSTITAKCKVTVSESLESAKLYGKIDQGKIILAEGETAELNVELWDSNQNPFDAKADDIKWVSLSENIATVEMNEYEPTNALVTANSVGKAYVAVVANDVSQTQIDIVEIIVVSMPTGITLSEHSVEDSLANKSYRLVATIQPEGAQELEVVWTSSDENIATVNNNGVVTYKQAGEVIITARVDTFTDSCILKIVTPVTGITLNEKEKTLMTGETLELIANISPANATHKDVIWESSDTRVAVVDERGVVTAVGSGTAHITARANGSDVSASCIINVYQQVLELKLNYDKLTVRKGTIFWLYATLIPDTALNRDIVWESSLPGVATVDEFGQITALASGITTITATSLDTGATDSCVITVSESVTGVTLNVREASIEIGEKLALIPTVTPIEAENKAVTYTTSDESVATVDANGVVTGLKGGTVIITCQTVDRGLIASCRITVNEYISDIRFIEKEIYIIKGDKKTLELDVSPKTATNKDFIWTSQNSAILHVDSDGVAYGVNYGTVIVTAMTTDGSEKRDTCKITVIKPVDSLILREDKIKVEEGKDYQLDAIIFPSDSSVQNVVWTSSDTSVAVVDNTGKVTGIKEGVCRITATAKDGAGAFDVCEVTVTKTIRVTSITVNPEDATMIVGEERQIYARMKPTNTTEVYSWISSDDSVVTVDKNGNVKAVGTGSATVTAVTDISGTEGSFRVTVIALNATKITLEQYDSYDLYLDGVAGADSSVNSKVTWYSRNKRVATVNANGQVIARQAGTTSIVARVDGKRVVCEITVVELAK